VHTEHPDHRNLQLDLAGNLLDRYIALCLSCIWDWCSPAKGGNRKNTDNAVAKNNAFSLYPPNSKLPTQVMLFSSIQIHHKIIVYKKIFVISQLWKAQSMVWSIVEYF